MIIRNSSNVRVNEPIWTHQRDRPQKSLGVGWILSACERDTLAARRSIKNAAR
jgi:hypothetical protein